MKSHRRCHPRIRALVLGLAACTALAAPASANAANDAAADYGGTQAAPVTKLGDTPADFAQALPTPKVGDTPADYPGASRAPEYTGPTTIQVLRPERTIVRDVDEVLPIVLSSMALLVALGGFAFARIGSIRRRRLGSRPLTEG
jgi:hypothetical protein